MHTNLTGVLPVVATPFDEQLAVDTAALADELDWLFANGAHGVTIAMVSEIQRLSLAERMELTDTVCRLVGDRGPVIASVGTESTHDSVLLARGARAAGASAVMLTPPLHTGTTDSELRAHLDTVIGAADLPTVLQDASNYAGQPIPPATQAQLVQTYGADRLLLKPEAAPLGPSITAIHAAATSGSARIFDGSGGIALTETHARGIVGTMPGPDLIWAIRAIWDALQAGDRRTAIALAGPLTMLQVMVTGLDSYVAFEKFLLVEQGVLPADRQRGPVAFMLDESARLLARELLGTLREAASAAGVEGDDRR